MVSQRGGGKHRSESILHGQQQHHAAKKQRASESRGGEERGAGGGATLARPPIPADLSAAARLQTLECERATIASEVQEWTNKSTNLRRERDRLARILKKMEPKDFDVVVNIHARGTLGVKLNNEKPSVPGIRVVSVEKQDPRHGLRVGDLLITMNGINMRDAKIERVPPLLKQTPAPHTWMFQQVHHVKIDKSKLKLVGTPRGVEVISGLGFAKRGDLMCLNLTCHQAHHGMNSVLAVLEHLFSPRHHRAVEHLVIDRSVDMDEEEEPFKAKPEDIVSHESLSSRLLNTTKELDSVSATINKLAAKLHDLTSLLGSGASAGGKAKPYSHAASRFYETVAVTCPVSLKRMRFPAVGNSCKKHKCFDQDSFKALESVHDSFIQNKCPLCKQFVSRLCPDLAFQAALERYPLCEKFLVERDALGAPIQYYPQQLPRGFHTLNDSAIRCYNYNELLD